MQCKDAGDTDTTGKYRAQNLRSTTGAVVVKFIYLQVSTVNEFCSEEERYKYICNHPDTTACWTSTIRYFEIVFFCICASVPVVSWRCAYVEVFRRAFPQFPLNGTQGTPNIKDVLFRSRDSFAGGSIWIGGRKPSRRRRVWSTIIIEGYGLQYYNSQLLFNHKPSKALQVHAFYLVLF